MNMGGNPSTALWCSGSNVSPQNYVLTNQHCVESQGECNTDRVRVQVLPHELRRRLSTNLDWEGFRCDEYGRPQPRRSSAATRGSVTWTSP